MAPVPPAAVISDPTATGPKASSTTRTVSFVLRLLSLISLVISVIVLSTNNTTLDGRYISVKIRFKDVYAYRYMLAAAVIALAYAAVQAFFAISQLATGNEPFYLLDFYGDKIASFVLATGAAAGFGATKDLKGFYQVVAVGARASQDGVDEFFDKAYASASVLLFAFLCTAILSVISSYALPKFPQK